MSKQTGESKNSDDNPYQIAGTKGSTVLGNIRWSTEFWSEHPEATLLLFVAGIFLPLLGDFMTKATKVWAIGFSCWMICAAIIIFVCKSVISTIETTGHSTHESIEPTMPRLVPTTTKAAPVPVPSTHPLTLKEIFDKDFNAGTIANSMSITSTTDGTKREIPYKMVYDFPSRTKYLAFYVPEAPDAFIQCRLIAENLQKVFKGFDESLLVIAKLPGEMSQTALKDLVFTGRVYVYHDSHLTLQELATLDAIFSANNAAVQFRGSDYKTLRWNEARTAFRL